MRAVWRLHGAATQKLGRVGGRLAAQERERAQEQGGQETKGFLHGGASGGGARVSLATTQLLLTGDGGAGKGIATQARPPLPRGLHIKYDKITSCDILRHLGRFSDMNQKYKKLNYFRIPPK
jgi:hypothetical protein